MQTAIALLAWSTTRKSQVHNFRTSKRNYNHNQTQLCFSIYSQVQIIMVRFLFGVKRTERLDR